MKTRSVTGRFPSRNARNKDFFFVVCLFKLLHKQSNCGMWTHNNGLHCNAIRAKNNTHYGNVPLVYITTLRWRHNERDSVSNHQPHDCLLNGLFRRRSKKTSKLRVTGLCVENSSGPVNSPHKGPVTRKMFPFDDVIMRIGVCFSNLNEQETQFLNQWSFLSSMHCWLS